MHNIFTILLEGFMMRAIAFRNKIQFCISLAPSPCVCLSLFFYLSLLLSLSLSLSFSVFLSFPLPLSHPNLQSNVAEAFSQCSVLETHLACGPVRLFQYDWARDDIRTQCFTHSLESTKHQTKIKFCYTRNNIC